MLSLGLLLSLGVGLGLLLSLGVGLGLLLSLGVGLGLLLSLGVGLGLLLSLGVGLGLLLSLGVGLGLLLSLGVGLGLLLSLGVGLGLLLSLGLALYEGLVCKSPAVSLYTPSSCRSRRTHAKPRTGPHPADMDLKKPPFSSECLTNQQRMFNKCCISKGHTFYIKGKRPRGFSSFASCAAVRLVPIRILPRICPLRVVCNRVRREIEGSVSGVRYPVPSKSMGSQG